LSQSSASCASEVVPFKEIQDEHEAAPRAWSDLANPVLLHL
jgi:hypothetical protein